MVCFRFALKYCVCALAVLLLLFRTTEATPNATEAQEHRRLYQRCEVACQGSSDGIINGCDCCYYAVPKGFEAFSSRDWPNTGASNGLYPKGDRTDWYRQRRPQQPIVGDDTLIAACLYTVSNSVLKLTALFPPLHLEEPRTAVLKVTSWDGSIEKTANCNIVEETWHCLFRVPQIPATKGYRYQVTYQTYTYQGVIPTQVDYPKVAAISCFGPDDTKDKERFVDAVLDTKPDLIVLSGDQTYFHNGLGYGFLETMYTIHRLTQNLPVIVQMDDHDVGSGNIWGAKFDSEDSGAGFIKPACLINAIQKMVMGHHPDSATDATLTNGIDIYYTSFQYGLVDFAVIEARKFKSDVGGVDSLLGSAQEEWLEQWCGVNQDKFKVILSQTPFAALGTLTTRWRVGGTVTTGRDKDTNGFPAIGRKRFMDIIEGCATLSIAGDQHLGIVVSYDDYGLMECVSPAAVNDIFWRMNLNEVGRTYLDNFGNQYRIINTWNVDKAVYTKYNFPEQTRPLGDKVKDARADGFLIVDLNGKPTCEMHAYRQGHRLVWSATNERPPTEAPTIAPTRSPVESQCSTDRDCGGLICAKAYEEPSAPLFCCPNGAKSSDILSGAKVCRGLQFSDGICSHNVFCAERQCAHKLQDSSSPRFCCRGGRVANIDNVKMCRNSAPRGSSCTQKMACQSQACIGGECA